MDAGTKLDRALFVLTVGALYLYIYYGTAAKTIFKRLDVVQAMALRVVCGAFRSTPIAALLVEMGETPLGIRRSKLAMQYICK